MTTGLRVVDLGRMGYADAHGVQCEHVDAVIASRAAVPEVGRLLLVEHDPVITIGRRAGAAKNLVASADLLARRGVEVCESDRGGDITYHGPGQIVAYPILDLNLLNLGLHDYMRLLEGAAIDACAAFGVGAERDPAATGVWVRPGPGMPPAKVCACGVRVRRWVSMHGLALNVSTDLDAFGLIVPCGLVGRPVTSLAKVLGASCPPIGAVKAALSEAIGARLERAMERALSLRRQASAGPA